MTYNIYISENLTYCYTEAELHDIALTVALTRSQVSPTASLIKTDTTYVQADKDEMENINVYGRGEDVSEVDVFHQIATVNDDNGLDIQFEKLEMPKPTVIDTIGGYRYALKQEAYYSNGYEGHYQAHAIKTYDGTDVMLYWDIINPDAEEESDMCDWENPCEVARI